MSSLNLTGMSFGQQQIGHDKQNASNLLLTKSNAILFIFTPFQNQFEDVGLRPYTYRFDDNFLNDFQQVTDLAKNAGINQSSLIDQMNTNLNLNDCIIPDPEAKMMFRASHLSGNYRFVLVLTDNGSGLTMPNTSFGGGNNQVRRIYTGYFLDEPIGRTTLGGKPTTNPNSVMVITHKTVVGTTFSSSSWGQQSKVVTRSSDEIFNPHASLQLTATTMADNRIHLMTPDNCLNSVDMTEEGDTLIMPGVQSDLTRWNASSYVPGVLEQPEFNVSQIVKATIRYQEEMNNRGLMLGRRASASMDDHYVDESMHRMKMVNHLQLPRSSNNTRFDLDVDSHISASSLDDMVDGNLEIIPITLERPMYYETADHAERSLTNQYSFFIATVISPMLSGVGLNDIDFAFDIANIRGTVETSWRIDGAGPHYPVSAEQVNDMVRAVKYELEQGVFKTIFGSVGDFSVYVRANATGMTAVRLSLVGMGYTNPVDFTFPSCMGGLVSPLLGDSVSHQYNSSAVESLFHIATGSDRTPSYFNDEDRQYLNHYNSLNLD